MIPKRIKKLVRKAREEIADYGVFRVERSAYEGLARPIFTYACPDWCNVIAETDDGQIVLVWQYRFGTDALSLEVPGGVVDPGEPADVAAIRELREETGYHVDSVELLSVVDPNPAMQGNRCFTYLARGARLIHATAFDELEDLELVLAPRSELPRLIDEGLITHALVVHALETYLRRAASSSTKVGM
jgi:ADP-ribose pyrophosphatase